VSGRFLWDGSDGEPPAGQLPTADLRLLLDALGAYRPKRDLGVVVWPTLGEQQDLLHWLTRWYRAQDKWEEDRQEEEPDAPF
jgi:hypothetical protein